MIGGVAVFVLVACGLPTTLWAAEGAAVDYKPDVTYATVAGEELKLDLASPKGLDHAVPAIVVIHGGGWMAGKRQDMTAIAKDAAAHGYVAATISYRFAPKHRFPAQIEDAKCAVRYLRAHAKELNIDPQADWRDGHFGRCTLVDDAWRDGLGRRHGR